MRSQRLFPRAERRALNETLVDFIDQWSVLLGNSPVLPLGHGSSLLIGSVGNIK
jgi:hypothetical protein